MPRLPKPNLLLCFDAFGTLFSPSSPVAAQYATVARQCGLNVSLPDLEKHLFAAIKEERKLSPNYGNATGLGATQWWTNIIHKTFKPLLPPSQPIPPSLTPSLLHRFASSEGYSAAPTLLTTIRHLKHHAPFSRVIIGIITNSDDRVPSILTSLGLNVSPTRYGDALASGDYDIDFNCMSYDVGAEKPHPKIFKAAEDMVSVDETWEKVYVGDEWDKDVVGAQKAGWGPILLDVDGKEDVVELNSVKPCSVGELFETHKVVKVRSLDKVATWFTTRS